MVSLNDGKRAGDPFVSLFFLSLSFLVFVFYFFPVLLRMCVCVCLLSYTVAWVAQLGAWDEFIEMHERLQLSR